MDVASILGPFCSTERFRPYLHRPFSRDAFTYATDGQVCLRVQRVDDLFGEVEHAPAAEKVFAPHDFDAATFALPPVGVIPPKTFTECSECDGRGYEHECSDCTCQCEACDGEGKEDDDYKCSVGVYGIPVSVRAVRRVWALPGLLLGPTPTQQGAAWPFKFDGGVGVFMSRRERAENHTEWTSAATERDPAQEQSDG